MQHVRPAGEPTRARRAPRRSELDHFLSRLFGELLSQPGYGFHESFDAGEITAKVIESARKFRQVMAAATGAGRGRRPPLGQEYIELVQDGVVAAQYVRSWQRQPEDAVLIAPAYTFLMRNQPVEHQFWLDVGATGWWERLNQPITHPYVLSRRWEPGQQWTDLDEYFAAAGGDGRAGHRPGASLPEAGPPGAERAERGRQRPARHAAADDPARAAVGSEPSQARLRRRRR